jgi:hypothetical protein
MTDLRTHDWAADPIFDSAVISHGFTSYMRDYDVVIEVPAIRPDGRSSYIEGRYRYRFTHCVEAVVKTSVPPETWRTSWSDEFISYAAWQRAGEPNGFVWGVEWAEAYPGVERLELTDDVTAWIDAGGEPMQRIQIETNVYVIELVCHNLLVTRLATGRIGPRRTAAAARAKAALLDGCALSLALSGSGPAAVGHEQAGGECRRVGEDRGGAVADDRHRRVERDRREQLDRDVGAQGSVAGADDGIGRPPADRGGPGKGDREQGARQHRQHAQRQRGVAGEPDDPFGLSDRLQGVLAGEGRNRQRE